MTSLNKKIGVGIVWNLANMLVSRGASVIFTLFLARFLAPESFGLMAMVAICYALADALMTSGFGQAIIRQKHISDEDLSTAFFTNLAFSFVTYVLLYAVAPWVAMYYEQAELISLIRVMGLVLFINSLKVVQLAMLSRDMDFKSLMRVNSTATIVAGVIAVSLAYAGYGVWSLVAQFMTTALVSTGLLWFYSAWRPSLTFNAASFKRLFGFGSKLTLESILNVLYENSYILVIGKLFSPEITGLYYFAKRIRDLIVDQVNAAVQQATYPAMAQIQEEDVGLKNMYRMIVQLLFFVITPCLLLLTLLADPLFRIDFEDRWLPAVPYLQLLCIAGIMFPVHTINLNMLKVKGRPDLVVYVGLVKKGTHLALLAAMAPFGILEILAGQIVASVLSCAPYMYYSTKLIGYRYAEQLKDIFRPIVAATLALAATWFGSTFISVSLPVLVLACGASFSILYLAMCHVAQIEGYTLVRNKLLVLLNSARSKKQASAHG